MCQHHQLYQPYCFLLHLHHRHLNRQYYQQHHFFQHHPQLELLKKQKK
jgi:hypothetical protein